MKTLFAVGSQHYATPFSHFFEESFDFTRVRDYSLITDQSVVLFTGGEDISTRLYHQKSIRATGIPNVNRDSFEYTLFDVAKKAGAKMIGICRGAQMLTVLNGGSLIQDVRGHAIGGTHVIQTVDGKSIPANSTHHQMMNPFNMDKEEFEVIAVATPRLSTTYLVGERDDEEIIPGVPRTFQSISSPVLKSEDMEVEPEIVFYPKTNTLCIQGHPESMAASSEFVKYCQHLVETKLL